MFRNYEMYCPWAAKKTISWVRIGDYELCATLSDGSKVIYDDYYHSIRNADEYDTGEKMFTEGIYKLKFSRNLRNTIQHSRLSNKEIAERCGLSEITISRYVNGQSLPTAIQIHKLARVLSCTASDLTDLDKY